MKYLVLRQFTAYGKLLKKGTIVDESEIRSPRIRISERVIVPAVSSLEAPVEIEAEDSTPLEVQMDVDINKGSSVTPEKPAPLLLSIRK